MRFFEGSSGRWQVSDLLSGDAVTPDELSSGAYDITTLRDPVVPETDDEADES